MSDRSYEGYGASSVTRIRSILRNVYMWMTLGLAITGIVALLVSSSSFGRSIISNPAIFIVLIIAELALVVMLSRRIMHMSTTAATLGFAGYAVLNGITLSWIFLFYELGDISLAFFVTAGTFAGMSIFALTTKTDLRRFGSFLFMGLIGIIIASVINIFLRSELFYWIISYAGVAVFLGLTAYDTQIIARWSTEMSDSVSEGDYLRISVLGALKLYLDFINLFLFFLRIFGRSR